MIVTTPVLDNLTLNIQEDIHVHAPLAETFAALLEQLGPSNTTPDGRSLQTRLEAWPGGRWFRDLGDGVGHFWGHVQAIKPPTLLEISGPLFMSAPVISNVQYRLTEVDGGTLIAFRHSAFGFVPDDLRGRIGVGWHFNHEQLRRRLDQTSTH